MKNVIMFHMNRRLTGMTNVFIDAEQFTEDYKTMSYVELQEKYKLKAYLIPRIVKQLGLSKKKGRRSVQLVFKPEES